LTRLKQRLASHPLQTIVLGLDYLRGKTSADENITSVVAVFEHNEFEMSEENFNDVLEQPVRLINSGLLAAQVNVALSAHRSWH
jgi:hypothetical protein